MKGNLYLIFSPIPNFLVHHYISFFNKGLSHRSAGQQLIPSTCWNCHTEMTSCSSWMIDARMSWENTHSLSQTDTPTCPGLFNSLFTLHTLLFNQWWKYAAYTSNVLVWMFFSSRVFLTKNEERDWFENMWSSGLRVQFVNECNMIKKKKVNECKRSQVWWVSLLQL